MLWVEDELSFDLFNKDSNRIYRVLVEENAMDGYENSAMTMPPLADKMKEKIPEIEKAATFEMNWNIVVKVKNKYLNEVGLAVAGSQFFDIFSFPFKEGNPGLFKSGKYIVCLSESTASKYFGEEDPLGKYIYINEIPVKVIAVFNDINYNSHIRFNLIIPEELGITIFGRTKESSWGNQVLFTYLKLVPNTDAGLLASKIRNFIPDYVNPESKQKLLLQPLKEIHLQKNLSDEDYTYLGDSSLIRIFSLMGFFVLILACINFINLSTAISGRIIKENGLRKIFGANKSILIRNSIIKSVEISGIATILSLILLYIILPFINVFASKNMNIHLLNSTHIIGLLSIIIFTGVFSGLYPAYYLTSFSPLSLVQNSNPVTGSWQRKSLVIFQFALSIFFIIATFISVREFNHIRKMNPGFDRNNVMYFSLHTDSPTFSSLKEKLLKIPGIEMVAGKNFYSPAIINTSQLTWQGNDKMQLFSDNSVDENFFPLLKVNFLDGQNFSKDLNNAHSIIINKKAKELIGIDDPIGMNLKLNGKEYKVVGVIDEVHFRSVKTMIQPEFYTFNDSPGFIFIRYYNNITSNVNQLRKQIQSTVNEFYPDIPCDFKFLDQAYARLYENDKQVGSIFGLIAFIAIMISCLGLYGLSLYSAENRTKEIGIRKINGAHSLQIIINLNKDFLLLVAIAFIISCPVAWYSMHKWLLGFVYKTELRWWIFALTGIISAGIALITVSWQSWRAATRNPVDALRHE